MELSESLRRNGHTVFLGGTRGPWLDEDIDETFLALDLLKVTDAEASTMRRIARALKTAAILRRFLKKERVELIHAHESAPAIVARLATLGTRVPVLVTYHGSAPERIRYFGRICRLTAKLIITPSHRCATELCDQGGVPKRSVEVIGLGVQPPPVIAAERVVAHRQKLLDPAGRILVVTIARLDHQKGIDVLIDVVREIGKRRNDIRFVVVGDGPLRNEGRRWAASANVESLIRFEGETNEPYLYLKAADLFLLTSRWEALPITIAEAFQTALPVVATDTGGVAELVSRSVGYVVPVGDVDALTESILEVCSDEHLRNRLSAAALSLSKERRFSLPHIHQIIENKYAEILSATTRDATSGQ